MWEYVEERDVPPEASSLWIGLLYQAKHTSSQIWCWETESCFIVWSGSLLCESVSQQTYQDRPALMTQCTQYRDLKCSHLLHMASMCAVTECCRLLGIILLHLPLLTSVHKRVQESLWQLEKSAGCNCDVSMLFWSWINSRSKKLILKSDWIFCPLFTQLRPTLNSIQKQILKQFQLFWQHRQN